MAADSVSMSARVTEVAHLNARADQCSPATLERGQRIVRFQGEPYVMVGLYFARGHNGQRDLFYILRPVNGRPER